MLGAAKWKILLVTSFLYTILLLRRDQIYEVDVVVMLHDPRQPGNANPPLPD